MGQNNWTLERRIGNKVSVDGDCWIWTGAKLWNGYGHLGVGGKHWLAHRYVYIELTGDDPDDKDLDHLCRRKACVNPDHLEVVTRSENLQRGTDGIHGRRVGCVCDHPFDNEHTFLKRAIGKRVCKTCNRTRTAIQKRRQELGPDDPDLCKRGHPFDDDNTYWNGGQRSCRRCAHLRYRRRKYGTEVSA